MSAHRFLWVLRVAHVEADADDKQTLTMTGR